MPTRNLKIRWPATVEVSTLGPVSQSVLEQYRSLIAPAMLGEPSVAEISTLGLKILIADQSLSVDECRSDRASITSSGLRCPHLAWIVTDSNASSSLGDAAGPVGDELLKRGWTCMEVYTNSCDGHCAPVSTVSTALAIHSLSHALTSLDPPIVGTDFSEVGWVMQGKRRGLTLLAESGPSPPKSAISDFFTVTTQRYPHRDSDSYWICLLTTDLWTLDYFQEFNEFCCEQIHCDSAVKVNIALLDKRFLRGDHLIALTRFIAE